MCVCVCGGGGGGGDHSLALGAGIEDRLTLVSRSCLLSGVRHLIMATLRALPLHLHTHTHNT